MSRLFDLLREPSLVDVDVDSNDRLAIHAKVLAHKPMLMEVFTEFHQLFNRLDQQYFNAKGLKIEIGAGVSPIKNTYRDVLATDLVKVDGLDRTLNAESMDIAANSVRAIYGQNCFHHLPHPERFFRELERVLLTGGGAILLEPYYGPFASILFKRLFTTEGFDKSSPYWDTPDASTMIGANQALSYLVFVRDRKVFEKKFPTLKIVHHERCNNYLKYLLSGGLNFRQLCPDWCIPLISAFQWLLLPVNHLLALHHVIVIKKVVT